VIFDELFQRVFKGTLRVPLIVSIRELRSKFFGYGMFLYCGFFKMMIVFILQFTLYFNLSMHLFFYCADLFRFLSLYLFCKLFVIFLRPACWGSRIAHVLIARPRGRSSAVKPLRWRHPLAP